MGGLGISILAYQVFFAPSAAFETGQLDPSRYPGFGLFCAIAIGASILTSTRGTHTLIPRLKSPPPAAPFTLGRVLGEVREVVSNRSYRMLILAALFGSVALGFGDVVGLYMNTYFWEFSTDQITLLLFPLVAATLISVLGVRPVSERFDKKSTALALSVFGVALGPLPIFLRLIGWMPANGEPLLLYLIMGHALLVVTAFISIMMLIVSMIADTVDQNELVTGKRQEGLFSSAIALTTKATSGIGGFVAGVALDWIQFPQQAEVGSVAPEKIFALGLAVGPGMLIFYLLTLVFLARYKITREEHREIIAELARRRARVESVT
jgi:Na+/melibiose symporter-like transporter